MTKLLKAVIRLKNGEEKTIRTYANDSHVTPEQAFAAWIGEGAELVSYEWIDTLSGPRAEWNAQHPDLQIPMDM